jgi:transposase
MRYRPIEERFAEKYVIDAETGCWNWTGAKIPGGYGHLHQYRGNDIPAHRFSYECHIGPVPAGMIVRHTCDNPGCVNPNHLCLGTHVDNMKDMDRRGRARVLSAEQVSAILSMLETKSQTAVAEEFGVNRATIQRAINHARAGDYGPSLAISAGDKPHISLSSEQRSEAIWMLEAGERVMTVAKHFGVDRKTIRNLRPKHVAPPPMGRPRRGH